MLRLCSAINKLSHGRVGLDYLVIFNVWSYEILLKNLGIFGWIDKWNSCHAIIGWYIIEIFLILTINHICFRATSPPSFALEVFVKCEAETRFRRLCLPFLYSHSSSNVLEVEVIWPTFSLHCIICQFSWNLAVVLFNSVICFLSAC